MIKRGEYNARLELLLSQSSLSGPDKEEIRRRYHEWGDYFDKRFFNIGSVIAQSMVGKFEPDDELKEIAAIVAVEMTLALEEFMQKVILYQVMLTEKGEHLSTLESPMSCIPKLQAAAENGYQNLKKRRVM